MWRHVQHFWSPLNLLELEHKSLAFLSELCDRNEEPQLYFDNEKFSLTSNCLEMKNEMELETIARKKILSWGRLRTRCRISLYFSMWSVCEQTTWGTTAHVRNQKIEYRLPSACCLFYIFSSLTTKY